MSRKLAAEFFGTFWVVLGGCGSAVLAGGFAANGYGDHSPGHYGFWACVLCEIVMTFFFLLIILGVTSARAPLGFAPIPIGLGLTLIHLISIPVTNTSVNPARSTGHASPVSRSPPAPPASRDSRPGPAVVA